LDEESKTNLDETPRVQPRKSERPLWAAIPILLTIASGIWSLRGDFNRVGDEATSKAVALCTDRIDQATKELETAINRERERAQERERELQSDIRELRTQTLSLRGRR